MFRKLVLFFVLAKAVIMAAGIAAPAQVQAQGLPQTTAPVLLTVFRSSDASELARFDMAMLKHLPATEFTTSTIWTAGVATYSGVSLSTLLAQLDTPVTAIRALSISDFAAEIPRSEIEHSAPIIAYARDGLPMTRREKGPLWLLYPYDSSEKYQTEVIYARSVAQLDRIEILH